MSSRRHFRKIECDQGRTLACFLFDIRLDPRIDVVVRGVDSVVVGHEHHVSQGGNRVNGEVPPRSLGEELEMGDSVVLRTRAVAGTPIGSRRCTTSP